MSFSEDGRGVINGYVTSPTPILTLTAALTKLKKNPKRNNFRN
jgi:hypothetical protein